MAGARVWLITGASRGLGRAFAEAALAAGDRVVAAARNVGPLEELTEKYPGHLIPLPLDVADRQAVFEGVERAAAAFGRLDVPVLRPRPGDGPGPSGSVPLLGAPQRYRSGLINPGLPIPPRPERDPGTQAWRVDREPAQESRDFFPGTDRTVFAIGMRWT
ncbi:SDR family NAD(P)-dependent oxidoreductase [Streptomyces mutabilis]|uniref:SDR family NAD(P)-dependent oxidoreductase n=1 Tax=Streptomyces mutabilis TaxID=67332 RepID=UPI0022BA1383|nr:SDR family NAD(P)-dependent oxidoreductase [Streptomyces mutabilis]MCZ9351670.1 SDR family NAD(P)-dependent oxidoreductase [Streptomyces mutabilis]